MNALQQKYLYNTYNDKKLYISKIRDVDWDMKMELKQLVWV